MSEKEYGKGFVTSYDSFKGFGFIRREKGKDVFFFMTMSWKGTLIF